MINHFQHKKFKKLIILQHILDPIINNNQKPYNKKSDLYKITPIH